MKRLGHRAKMQKKLDLIFIVTYQVNALAKSVLLVLGGEGGLIIL